MPNNRTPITKASCPLCGKPTAHDVRPFCSRGCRDRDLNAWFDEDYKIAAPIHEESDSDDVPPEQDVI